MTVYFERDYGPLLVGAITGVTEDTIHVTWTGSLYEYTYTKSKLKSTGLCVQCTKEDDYGI
jgi:hypothetical protein